MISSRESPRPWLRRGGAAVSGLGAVVGAALLPKCPLCIAAALSAFGLGAGVAGLVAPLLRPSLLAGALLLLALAVIRRRRARRCSCATEP